MSLALQVPYDLLLLRNHQWNIVFSVSFLTKPWFPITRSQGKGAKHHYDISL